MQLLVDTQNGAVHSKRECLIREGTCGISKLFGGITMTIRTIGAAFFILATGGVTEVLAQSASEPSQATAPSETLGEILVTAEKRSERLADVPLSITAQTSDELTKVGVHDVSDLEKVVPGFAYTQSVYGAPIFTIRGIGFYGEAVGISPTVSVYVDQVPIPFTRAAEGVSLDLERVEVLKGPQGTLFGQNSTGGAINYIAAKPTDALAAGANVNYGRFNDASVEGFVSGPIASTLTARVAVRTEQRDAWQYSSYTGETLGKRNFTAGRALLDWKPFDGFSFELNFNGWKDKSDAQANQFERYDSSSSAATSYPGSVAYPNIAATLLARPPTQSNDRAANWDTEQSEKRDDDFYQISGRGDLTLPAGLTLSSISSYSQLVVHSPADSDGTELPIFWLSIDAFTKTFAQEIRLSSSGEDRVRWMVGGNYQYDRVSDVQYAQNQGSNSGVGPIRFIAFENDANGQHIRTAAAFGSLDWRITDTLTAQTSARYTHQTHDLNGCLRDVGGQLATAFGLLSTVINGDPHVPAPGDPSYIPEGGCATLDDVTNDPTTVHKSLDERNVSWRAGLSWKPDPESLVYGNVTRGFKGGSFETLPAIRPDQFDPVPQEQVTAYEVGARSRLFEGKIDLSGAAFYYDYKDKQLLAYISDNFFGSLPGLVSVPKSRATGVELDITVRPTSDWYVSVGGSYVATKVESKFSALGPLASSGSVDVQGSSFPNTPKLNFLTDTEYRFPLVDDWQAFVGGNATYRSGSVSTFAAPSEFDIPSYTLLDARAGVQRTDGKLRVWLWGKNITDRYYWTHVDHVLDTVTRITGMPATYGISASWRL